MLDALINSFPPVIYNQKLDKRAYFTMGAYDNEWHIAYTDDDGFPVSYIVGSGVTLYAALNDFKALCELNTVLTAPALNVDELTGKINH